MKSLLPFLLSTLVTLTSASPNTHPSSATPSLTPILLSALAESGPDECCTNAYKSACTMNLERMWHVKLFYNRNPNITEEEFNRHWAYEHPKVVGDLYMKHGYVRYSQFHSTEKYRDVPNIGIPIMNFDGAAEFWVHDLQNMKDMQEDPEYISRVGADEAKFIDLSSMQILVGVDYVHVENGGVVGGHARKF